MSATFYDSSGAEYEVDPGGEAEAQAMGLTSTPPGAASGAPVATMVDSEGAEYEVDAGGREEALAMGLMDPQAAAPAAPESGVLDTIATAAEGLGSGTFFGGMSQPVAALEGLGVGIGNAVYQDLNPGAPEALRAPDLMGSLEQARADIAARQEASPVTNVLTKGAGMVAATLVTGGANQILAQTAERAAVATASRVGIPAVIGEGATQAAALIAKGTLGQRAIVAAARAAIPAAAEGAAFGAAAGVDEAMEAAYVVDGELNAGDYGAIAEAGAEGLALGALIGFGSGVVLAPIAEVATAAGRSARDMFGRVTQRAAQKTQAEVALVDSVQDAIATERSLMEPAAIELAPDTRMLAAGDITPPSQPGTGLARVGDAAEDTMGWPVPGIDAPAPPPFQNGLKQARAFDAEKLIDDQGPMLLPDMPAETVGRARRIAETLKANGTYDDIEANAGREITKKLDELTKLEDRSNTLNAIAAKRQWATQFNDGISRTAHPETVETVKSIAGRLMGWLDDSSEYALGKFGGLGKAKTAAKAIQESATRYEAAMFEGRAGDAAMILDDTKRMLGDFANAKNDALNSLIRGRDGKGGLYGELQRHMQDEQVFGAFAQAQAPVNATWSSHITAAKDAETRGIFMTAGEVGADSFESGQKSNQKWIKQWLGGTQKWEQESEHVAAIRLLRAKANDMTARAKVWGSPAMKAEAARAQKLVVEVEDHYNAVAAAAAAKGKVAGFVDALGDAPVIGGTVKAAVTVSSKLAKAIGGAPTASERVTHAAVQSNAIVMSAAKQAAETATSKGTPKSGLTKFAPAIATIAAVNAYVRDAAPESPATRALNSRARDLQKEAPELVQPLVDLNDRKRAFIREKAGPMVAAGGRDPVTQLKLVRYIDAAEHPDDALQRIAQGTVWPEDVETLWEVYPSRMVKFRDQTLRFIQQSGQEPSREMKQKYSFAFRMHDAEYMQWLQSSIDAAQEQAPQPQATSATVEFAIPGAELPADRLANR